MHTPPNQSISLVIDQFIQDHGALIGFEAWQTYHEQVGERDAIPLFKQAYDRSMWNEVAQAVLADFAVWYETGHYRENETAERRPLLFTRGIVPPPTPLLPPKEVK